MFGRLLDQRCALEWIQRYIGAFGGDSQNITIFGNSSGAGVTLYDETLADVQFRVMLIFEQPPALFSAEQYCSLVLAWG